MVGFVFSLLVSLAAAAYHYGFAYFSPVKPVVNDSEPKRRFLTIVLGVGFLYTAGLISALLGNFIFFQSPVQHDRTNWIQSVEGIGLYMLAFVLLMIASGNFRKRPEVATLLSLLGLAFAILALFGRPGFSRPFGYLILMLAMLAGVPELLSMRKVRSDSHSISETGSSFSFSSGYTSVRFSLQCHLVGEAVSRRQFKFFRTRQSHGHNQIRWMFFCSMKLTKVSMYFCRPTAKPSSFLEATCPRSSSAQKRTCQRNPREHT